MPRPALPAAVLLALLAGACATPGPETAMTPATCTATTLPAEAAAPRPESAASLVTRRETFAVPLPRAAFTAWFDAAPLERLLPGGGGLLGVTGTQPMGALPFPQPGSRRLVCLADGSTALEQVLEHEAGRRLRYIVWGYTTPAAAPIAYGLGEFRFTDAAGGGTAVEWSYAFHLREDRFPGMLGAAGRGLFRLAFLDMRYAAFMRAGVAAITREAVRAAERPPA